MGCDGYVGKYLFTDHDAKLAGEREDVCGHVCGWQKNEVVFDSGGGVNSRIVFEVETRSMGQ